MKHIKLTTFSLAFILAMLTTVFYNYELFLKIYTIYEDSTLGKVLFVIKLFFIVLFVLNALYNLLAVKYFSKIIFIFILIANSMAMYFIHTYNILIDKYMMINAFKTDSHEVLDLFHYKILVYLFCFAILPSVLLYKIKIIYKPFVKEFTYKAFFVFASLSVAIVILLIWYKDISSFARNRNNNVDKDMINNVIPYNYITSTITATKMLTYNKPTFKTIVETANLGRAWNNAKKPTLMVFVVGETSREPNFSQVAYSTFLKRDDLIIFNNTKSCGTATAISVPCMFSNLQRENFNLTQARYQENLLDVLTKASFNVSWINNNSGCQNVCDRVNYKNLGKNKSITYDEDLITELKHQVKSMQKSNKPNFVVLHALGSHGPTYYLRYPKKFSKYLPDCETSDLQQCSKENVINSYNNTIYYEAYVLNELIKYLDSRKDFNTAMIYLSDHGESLGENGLYLHGLPYMIAPDVQKTVPFFMWISKGFKNQFIKNKICLNTINKKQYSHDNIFSSVLGLLNVESNLYNKNLDIFTACR